MKIQIRDDAAILFCCLGILFLVLKGTGFIDLSWWVILAPVYVAPVLLLLFFILMIICSGFIVLFVLVNEWWNS